jgi:hypothetical protein
VYSQAFAGADMNADGIEDMVAAAVSTVSGQPSLLNVLLGNGDGTLAAPASYAFDQNDSRVAVGVGDANNDGKQDAIVWATNVGELIVYPGRGDGTLDAPKVTVVPSVSNVLADTHVALGDMNGDGNLDVAVVHQGPTPTSPFEVALLLGNGDGTFAPEVARPVGMFTTSLVTGDFAGRGRSDIVATNLTSNDLSYLESAPVCGAVGDAGSGDGG